MVRLIESIVIIIVNSLYGWIVIIYILFIEGGN